MPDDAVRQLALAWAAVVTRTGFAFFAGPLPGFAQAPAPARVVLTLAFSAVLMPLVPPFPTGAGASLVRLLAGEAVVGLLLGYGLGLLLEGVQAGLRLIALTSGYGFASTIDPMSHADSTAIESLGQLAVALLVFSLGLDREWVRVLAASFSALPPGHPPAIPPAQALGALLAAAYLQGLRLALPVLAVLLAADLALALLSRVNAQMQLLTLALPLKMLVALFLLAALAGGWGHRLAAAAGPWRAWLDAALRAPQGAY